MNTHLEKILIGTTSVTGIELAQHVELPTSTEVKDIISIIIQLAIGLATLIGLFKKPKIRKE